MFLGHAGLLPGGEPQVAAIKLFHPHVSESSIAAEISALSVLRHAHILRLLDLATGPRNAPCLILQRLEPGGLPRLVAERQELEPGEAVTILAPLVDAVAAMHRAGVFHGRLGAQAVLFDSSGAPVLGGFGVAGSIASGDRPVTPALRDADTRMAGDRDALVALVGSVLGRVRGASALADDFVRWLGEKPCGDHDLVDLELRLFELAPPVPVRFDTDARLPAVPHRLDGAPHGTAPEVRTRPAGPPLFDGGLDRDGWRGVAALPPEIVGRLASLRTQAYANAPDWLLSAWAALRAFAGPVRRRVWIVGGIGFVAIASALVVAQLPTPGEASGAAPSAGEPTLAPPAPPAAVGPRDPIMAARQLIELRAKCLNDRSISCLDAVHAPASPAWQADAARIHGVQSGAELMPDSFGPTSSFILIDRMGDTVLLGLAPLPPETATASVLMIKTEAGWRFRSLLDGSSPPDG